jgi:response regulator of citrate/malate metabolism
MPEKIKLDTFTDIKQSTIRQLVKESKGAAQETHKRQQYVSVTLKRVIEWIEEQEYDDYTKNELIKTISAYPHSILHRYKFLIKNQLPRIQRERNKKLK